MKTIDRIMRVFHFRILKKGRWIYRPKHCACNHKSEDNSKNVWNNESKPCENLRKQSYHVCSLNHWNNCHHENVNWKRHFLLIRQWNIQMTNRDNVKYYHGISQAHIFFFTARFSVYCFWGWMIDFSTYLRNDQYYWIDIHFILLLLITWDKNDSHSHVKSFFFIFYIYSIYVAGIS